MTSFRIIAPAKGSREDLCDPVADWRWGYRGKAAVQSGCTGLTITTMTLLARPGENGGRLPVIYLNWADRHHPSTGIRLSYVYADKSRWPNWLSVLPMTQDRTIEVLHYGGTDSADLGSRLILVVEQLAGCPRVWTPNPVA